MAIRLHFIKWSNPHKNNIDDLGFTLCNSHHDVKHLTKVVKWYGKNYSSHIAAYNFGSIQLHSSVIVIKGAVTIRPQPITLLFLLIMLQCNLKI